MSRFTRKQYIAAVFALAVLFLYLTLFGLPQHEIQVLHHFTLSPNATVWTRRQRKYPYTGQVQKLPTGRPLLLPTVQHKFAPESAEAKVIRESRLQAVKDSFSHTWQGYKQNAWLSDELQPLSGGNKSSFGNWSATLIDSLDTLWIMGLHEDFEAAVSAVAGIDFESSTSQIISVFETTIRYLGGLLSAYDLSGNPVLIEKALELGNMLYAAFDTPNRMPVPYWNWKHALDGGEQSSLAHAVSADIGSLSMEFTRLSQLSGDDKFFDAIKHISDVFAEQQSNSSIPGLWPVFVNAAGEDFASGDEYSLGALSDSLYEYIPKMYILLGGLLPEYRTTYEKFIDAAKVNLLVRPLNRDNNDILFASNARVTDNDVILDGTAQHLACFVGGMVALAAQTFQRPLELETARRLTEGCVWAYNTMPVGIMPETITVAPCYNRTDCEWTEEAWHDAILADNDAAPGSSADEFITSRRLPPGFVRINDGRYILRPEAIESVFVMYRITGDTAWQEKAWRMFSAIEKATRTEIAHAALQDVAAEQPVQVDSMESFWTAETLKYFYLTFSDPDLISLDDYVFNTEAHPFRRPKPPKKFVSFGS